MNDMIGGQVPYFMSMLMKVVRLVRNARLHAIAINGNQRTCTLPQVPHMVELGDAEVSLKTWQGVGVPAGTPKVIICMRREFERLVSNPDTHTTLCAQALVPFCHGLARTAQMIAHDIERFGKLTKCNDIKYR